jgi:hypothetical protein
MEILNRAGIDPAPRRCGLTWTHRRRAPSRRKVPEAVPGLGTFVRTRVGTSIRTPDTRRGVGVSG